MTITTSSVSAPASLIKGLANLLGREAVLSTQDEMLVYECDGYIVEKQVPDIVVFPKTTEDVVQIVRLCNEFKVPFVPRGAGTSLAGGTLPVGGGVMICTSMMKEILEINVADRYAVTQPGTVNVHLTQKLKGTGFHFAPDPSSQGACTLGGNVATNSGGPHTLKYGVTVNHILGLEVVLPSGEVVVMGGPCADEPGYDLTGLFVGSEGTFGICTKIWVKLTRDTSAVRTMLGIFETVNQATEAISGIIAAGIIPAALEMMDQGIIGAVEAAFHFGFPLDAGAVLLIEVDGLEVGVDEEAKNIVEICKSFGAREIRSANTPAERLLLWKCRKQAFGAIGRLSPSFCTQDGVVPRTKLPDILSFIQETEKKFDLRILNIFHAGDGNIHPILMFDERNVEQMQRVIEAGEEILRKCIELGGSVTGEHGIGVEKVSLMPELFNPVDLKVMEEIRHVFNPENCCSPRKMLPTAGGCGMEHIIKKKPGRQAAM
ncbi:FAD-binding oxidoreductase [Planctomicrobium sp. SH668]|uniref:FAD-binding oxidoreductase n=1 Tax=Planctomicrobium sp. SH668 TaxID=3448126 RepID=UPI003F5C93C5